MTTLRWCKHILWLEKKDVAFGDLLEREGFRFPMWDGAKMPGNVAGVPDEWDICPVAGCHKKRPIVVALNAKDRQVVAKDEQISALVGALEKIQDITLAVKICTTCDEAYDAASEALDAHKKDGKE